MSVFEEFLKYEDAYNAYDKEVLGIKYWEFVRYAIFAEIKVRVNNMPHIVNIARPKQLKKYRISLKNRFYNIWWGQINCSHHFCIKNETYFKSHAKM